MAMKRKFTAGLTGLILALLLAAGSVSFNPVYGAEDDASSVVVSSADFFYWLYENEGDTDAYNAYLLLTTGSYGSTDITSSKDGEFYAATELGASGDATSLENLEATIEYLKECNTLRTTDDNFTGRSELTVNALLMAIAEIDTNWSSNNIAHAGVFNVGENLAWGYSSSNSPFNGWYTEEKEIYDTGASGTTGHYLNIVSSSYVSTGFAYSSSGGSYTTTYGQVFSSSSGQYSVTYTVDEFEALLDEYLEALTEWDCDSKGHVLAKYEETAAGCTSQGNIEYWQCISCGKCFSDESAETEIDEEDTVTAATGHSWTVFRSAVWSFSSSGSVSVTVRIGCENNCGYVLSYPVPTYQITYVDTVEATCTQDGERTYTAAFTYQGTSFSASTDVTVSATGHSIVQVEQLDATCTEDGYEAYWECENCGTMYADEDGETEIDSPEVIPAAGHSYDSGTVTKEATAKEDGVMTYTCTVCGDTYEEAIPAEGEGLFYNSETGFLEYYADGEIDTSYTGFASYDSDTWYVEEGIVDYGYTGMAKNEEGWWYFTDSCLDTGYTGMAKNEYGWWYITDGCLDTSYTGMAKNAYGWWYMTNGCLDTSYTGMAKNEYGWWYITNGKLDTSYTGLAKNAYGWWYMTNGCLDTSYTGMAKNAYGWWYVTDGKLDLTYTGLAKNEYGWWYMTNGKLDTGYTGMAKNEYGWWYVTGGCLDLTYTGLAENDYGIWYMVNGRLTYYTGTVVIDGVEYTVTNGKVD